MTTGGHNTALYLIAISLPSILAGKHGCSWMYRSAAFSMIRRDQEHVMLVLESGLLKTTPSTCVYSFSEIYLCRYFVLIHYHHISLRSTRYKSMK